jgi:hypothetical protein
MRRDPHYILRQTSDTLVIVPVGTATMMFHGMIAVNETGALLWDMLEHEHTEAELTDALCERYDAPMGRIVQDVQSFLLELRRAGALLEGHSA